MKILRVFIVLGILAVLIASAIPVYAMSAPTSISVVSVQVVRNTIENGDMAFIFEGEINYPTPPLTPTAAQAFIFRLYATNGSTVLKTQTPYALFNSGYGKLAGCFYFTAATAPSWGSTYYIKIEGLASYFSPLPSAGSYHLAAGNYSASTDEDDNQNLAESYIMDIAEDIEDSIGVTLIGPSEIGTGLTASGEAYFRGAVENVDTIAHGIFFTQLPGQSGITEYNENLGTQYGARLAASDLMIGFTRLGAIMGTTGQTLACLLAILIAAIAPLITAYKGWGIDPGLIGSSIILTAAAILLGEAMLTIRLVMGLLVAVILFYQLLFKRA